MNQKALCLLINAAIPYVPGTVSVEAAKQGEDAPPQYSYWMPAEIRFFEEINENLLPLLQTFEKLEKDKIPFKAAMVLSPLLCSALSNKKILARYRVFLDRQIAFGKKERARSANSKPLSALVRYYLERFVAAKKYLEERNFAILEGFRHFSRTGNIELLASPATDCYCPFYVSYPEVINVQLSVSLASEKKLLGEEPAGLWLPYTAYHSGLDDAILDHHFNYTIADVRALLFSAPPAAAGSFYPVRTRKGLVVFARDFYLTEALRRINHECYRDNLRDAGYELPREAVKNFRGVEGERNPTGYKYWFRSLRGGCIQGAYYDVKKARGQAAREAEQYAAACAAHLDRAAQAMGKERCPLAVITADIDTFGRNWTEGPAFLDAFFRKIHSEGELELVTPYDFLKRIDHTSLETVTPLNTSCSAAESSPMILDSSNDWIYRHIFRAVERMAEMAERFDDSGIRERLLNQAARELLLSQNVFLAAMLSDNSKAAAAKAQIEEHLKTFTAIYESLGTNFMSAKWLAMLEERDYVFPELNYRLFKKPHAARQGGFSGK